nr:MULTISPECIES: hypothetical protein [Providencia]
MSSLSFRIDSLNRGIYSLLGIVEDEQTEVELFHMKSLVGEMNRWHVMVISRCHMHGMPQFI